MVECLSSAQGMILESWDRVPHRAPCMEPASPSAYVSASLSPLSLMNKNNLFLKIPQKTSKRIPKMPKK